MDEKGLKKAERILLKEKTRLEKEIADIKPFPQYGTSDDDNAQEVEEFQSAIGLQRNLQGLLKAVNKALKKVADGTYGVCEICGLKIESGRLKAFPEAVLCASDAAKKARR